MPKDSNSMDKSTAPGQDRMIEILARGMARTDEMETAFDAGRAKNAAKEDADSRREYIDEAHAVLLATGKMGEICLFAQLYLNPRDSVTESDGLDLVEAYITRLETALETTSRHLALWNAGQLDRDEGWVERARRAASVMEGRVRFGRNLRLKILRKTEFSKKLENWKKKEAELLAALEREKSRRLSEAGCRDAERKAILDVIKNRDPDLYQRALDASNAAAQSFTQDAPGDGGS